MDLTTAVRGYWDADADHYDADPGHHPTDPLELAAWRAALADAAPAPGARVLDVGAGTGFLSLALAAMGHEVTALDLSESMLARLQDKAAAAGLALSVVVADAASPAPGPFDLVVSRHLLWTLPDPVATLQAWRRSAPDGQLALFESMWGAAPAGERLRRQGRRAVARLRGQASAHHAPYAANVLTSLPLGHGPEPRQLVALVEQAGWPSPRVRRLRDLDWAASYRLPLPDRWLSVAPRFVVSAG